LLAQTVKLLLLPAGGAIEPAEVDPPLELDDLDRATGLMRVPIDVLHDHGVAAGHEARRQDRRKDEPKEGWLHGSAS
jgi:hypothetical protein